MALGSEAEKDGSRNRIGGDRVLLKHRVCPALCFKLESHRSEENHWDFRDKRMTESELAGAAEGGVCGNRVSSFIILSKKKKNPVRQILLIAFPLGERQPFLDHFCFVS